MKRRGAPAQWLEVGVGRTTSSSSSSSPSNTSPPNGSGLLLPPHHHLRHSPDASKTKATTSNRRTFTSVRVLLFLITAVVTISFGALSMVNFDNTDNGRETRPTNRLMRAKNDVIDNTVAPTYYTPSLLSSNDDPSVIADWKREFNSSLIHLVHTRFMQEQGNLTSLGQARMHLFRIFCAPTMIQQTSQNFLWIIKTDPNLDASLLHQLLQVLQPYPNVYLVASLNNYRINSKFPGAWRNGAEPLDLSQSHVYTGHPRKLELAMALEAQLPILETRLDADDGLHLQFVETLQSMALHTFSTQPTLQWTYWCSRRHMEWHWMDLITIPQDKLQDSAYGVMLGSRHENFCITPGITVGFPVGVNEADVPIYPHDKIVITIRDELRPDEGCGLEQPVQCLQFIENFVFCALRSRTPTSAGMMNVQALDNEIVPPQSWLNYAYWDKVHDSFGLNREHMKYMNQYLVHHLVEIAEENLMGQCTTGHSCKEKAKRALQQLIAARRNASIIAADSMP